MIHKQICTYVPIEKTLLSSGANMNQSIATQSSDYEHEDMIGILIVEFPSQINTPIILFSNPTVRKQNDFKS